MATTQNYIWPAGLVTVSISAEGPNGSPIPTDSLLIGAEDPSHDLQPLQVDASGNLLVAIDATTPGLATAANQVLQIAQETGIHSDTTSIDGKTPTLGQKNMAGSSPVVIASDQSTIPVSVASLPLPAGAATAANQATQITEETAIAASVASLDSKTVHVDTGAVVVASSALPTGAATSANQTNASQKSQIVDGSGNVIASTANALNVNISSSSVTALSSNVAQFGGSNVVTGTGASGAGIPRVTISNDSSLAANQSVNLSQVAGATVATGHGTAAGAIRVELPTDGTGLVTVAQATAANLNATVVQGTAANLKASVNLNDGSGSAVNKGQTTAAGSLPVVLASDQSSIPSSDAGNTPLQFIRNDYTSVNVTTAAYVQLIASTSGITNVLEIFDSSGQTLKIAFGAAASEVDQFLVFPGGNGRITCKIAASTRISIRAVSATASVGEIDLNLYT